MKLNKEYPATHSMSTAWYAVDKDGNVAVLDFNDEGPQPDGIGAPYEYGLDDMIIDDIAEFCDGDVKVLPYTKEQIKDLIYMDMQKPEEIEFFDMNTILNVAEDRVDEFISRVRKLKKPSIIRISSETSLFCVSSDCRSFDKEMKKMVSEKIIIGGYFYNYYINDQWVNESVEWEKNFDRYPMYVYGQPYWYGNPMERLLEPEHPLKYEQLPKILQSKVLQLPISFHETEKLQIAEYTQFQMCSYFSTVYKGRYYEKLPLSNGEMKYLCSSVLPMGSSIRCIHCGMCEESEHLQNFTNTQCTDYPTVLILQIFNRHVRDLEYDCKLSSEIFFRKSYPTNLIHGYPGVNYCDLAPYEEQRVRDRFVNCRGYMELTVETLKPRVIILQDKGLGLVQEFYKVDADNHVIVIGGVTYPFYLLSEVSDNKDLINKLSLQPYMGRALSMEEKIVSIQIEYLFYLDAYQYFELNPESWTKNFRGSVHL